jgi:CspA family cold shock protein
VLFLTRFSLIFAVF